jgi:hypothetical protein
MNKYIICNITQCRQTPDGGIIYDRRSLLGIVWAESRPQAIKLANALPENYRIGKLQDYRLRLADWLSKEGVKPKWIDALPILAQQVAGVPIAGSSRKRGRKPIGKRKQVTLTLSSAAIAFVGNQETSVGSYVSGLVEKAAKGAK